MKKLIFLLMLIISSTAFADIISCPISERDIYLMSNLPENASSYKGNYIVTQNQVYYVNDKGTYENIEITDFQKFRNAIQELNPNNETKVHLSDEQISSVIKSGGGQTPPYHFSFNGIQWNIYLLRPSENAHDISGGFHTFLGRDGRFDLNCEHAPTGFPDDCDSTYFDEHIYHSDTKTIEGVSRTIDSILFYGTAAAPAKAFVIYDENGITLQCNGQYTSLESEPGRFKYLDFGHEIMNGMRATLLLKKDYKKCDPAPDNKSFNCVLASS